MDKAVAKFPSTAYSLSVAAGALILIGGAFSILIRVAYPLSGSFSVMETLTGLPGLSGALGLILGILVLMSGLMLAQNPERHEYYGTLILILSVLSILGGWAGFGIGLLLGIFGGALAIGWQAEQTQSTMFEATRVCLKCGKLTEGEVKFCPNCGNQRQQ